MTLTSNHSKSFLALVSGVVLLFVGCFIDPQGQIDSTVLFGAGELLIACMILAGFGEVVNKFLEVLDELKTLKVKKEE